MAWSSRGLRRTGEGRGSFYKGMLAAEPGADDRRRAELRIMAQREARQSLYFDLTTSWSKDISIIRASLGAAVEQAWNEGDRRGEALTAVLLARSVRFCVTLNNAALAQGVEICITV